MATTGSKKTKKSTEDLIKESRLRQQERMRQIAIMKEEKEKEIAHMQEVQNATEEAFIGEQNEQRYTGDKDKDKKTLSNWQRERNKEHSQKQASRYMNRYKTSGNDQIPANTRQKQNEDPKKRAEDEIRRYAIEETKAKIKQKAAQATRRAGQKAAQITAKMASQVSKIVIQGLRQAVIWIGGTALGAVTGSGCLTILVILIAIVLIIVAANQACNSATSNALSAGIPLFGLIKWWTCN